MRSLYYPAIATTHSVGTPDATKYWFIDNDINNSQGDPSSTDPVRAFIPRASYFTGLKVKSVAGAFATETDQFVEYTLMVDTGSGMTAVGSTIGVGGSASAYSGALEASWTGSVALAANDQVVLRVRHGGTGTVESDQTAVVIQLECADGQMKFAQSGGARTAGTNMTWAGRANGTIADIVGIVTTPGKLKYFRTNCSAAPGSGDTWSFGVQQYDDENDATATLSADIGVITGASQVTDSDDTTEITVAKDSQFYLRVGETGTCASAYLFCSYVFIPDTAGEGIYSTVYFGDETATEYLQFVAGRSVSQSSFNMVKNLIPSDNWTAKELTVLVSDKSTGPGTSTDLDFDFTIEGTSVNQTVQLDGDGTPDFYATDSSNSDSFDESDVSFGLKTIPTGSPVSLDRVWVAFTMVDGDVGGSSIPVLDEGMFVGGFMALAGGLT